MKIALFGAEAAAIEPKVIAAGFSIDTLHPEIVMACGGDGTLLKSEATYPEVPKFLLKNSKTCKLCIPHSADEVLKRLNNNEYTIQEVHKLKLEAGGHTWYALNEVVIRNQNPRHASRFSLETPLQSFKEVIGDGVIIATVFGSTGYYRSITKNTFQSGIGIAFNNTAQFLDSLVVPDKDFKCVVEIIRGPAVAFADIIPDEAVLDDGGVATVSLSEKKARIVTF